MSEEVSEHQFQDLFSWPDPQGFEPTMERYLYRNEVNRALELLRVSDKGGSEDSKCGRTIAVIGERGNGKTTFLRVLRNEIKNDKSSDIYFLPIMNPTNFSNHMNVLEALLATIKLDYDLAAKSHKIVYAREQLFRELNKASEAISGFRVSREKLVSSQSPTDYLDDSVNHQRLTDILERLIRTYLDFLNLKNDGTKQYKRLLLMIDDLDMLQTPYVRDAWVDIQNVLSNTSLSIVLTYRESQIRHALLSKLCDDNTALLKAKVISIEELEFQVASMISKQVPEQQTIQLMDAAELMKTRPQKLLLDIFAVPKDKKIKLNDKQIKELLQVKLSEMLGIATKSDPKVDFSVLSMNEWVDLFLRARLGLKWTPTAHYEQVPANGPQSFRDLVDFFKLLTRIADSPNNNSRNIELLRRYILANAMKYLPAVFAQALTRYTEVPLHTKNYQIYALLYAMEKSVRDQHQRSSIEFSGLTLNIDATELTINTPILQGSLARQENVALGDIVQVIWLLEAQIIRNEQVASFFCDFKRLYSLDLIESWQAALLASKAEPKAVFSHESASKVLDAKTEQSDNQIPADTYSIQNVKSDRSRRIGDYIGLVNTLFMPDNYNYLNLILEDTRAEESTFSVVSAKNIVNDDVSRQKANDFVAKMVYSGQSIHSRYNRFMVPPVKDAKQILSDDVSMAMQYSGENYFYRELEHGKRFKFENATRYQLDLFAWLMKFDYLYDAAENASSASTHYYVLQNVFDVDAFISAHYGRQFEGSKPLGTGDRMAYHLRRVRNQVALVNEVTIGTQAYTMIGQNLYPTNSTPVKWFFIQNDDEEWIDNHKKALKSNMGPNRSYPECLELMIVGRIVGKVIPDLRQLMTYLESTLITDGQVNPRADASIAKSVTANLWESIVALYPSENMPKLFPKLYNFEGDIGRKHYDESVRKEVQSVYERIREDVPVNIESINDLLKYMSDFVINPGEPKTKQLKPASVVELQHKVRIISKGLDQISVKAWREDYPVLEKYPTSTKKLSKADVTAELMALYNKYFDQDNVH